MLKRLATGEYKLDCGIRQQVAFEVRMGRALVLGQGNIYIVAKKFSHNRYVVAKKVCQNC